jgi:hypothetical protein
MGEGEGEGEDETSALRCGGAMQCGVMQCSAVRCSAVCAVWHLLLRRRVDRRVVEHAEDVTLPPRWARALRLSTAEARTPLAPSGVKLIAELQLQAARRRGGTCERVHGIAWAQASGEICKLAWTCERRTTPLGPAIAVHPCTQCACRGRPRRQAGGRGVGMPLRHGTLPMLDIRERNKRVWACRNPAGHASLHSGKRQTTSVGRAAERAGRASSSIGDPGLSDGGASAAAASSSGGPGESSQSNASSSSRLSSGSQSVQTPASKQTDQADVRRPL